MRRIMTIEYEEYMQLVEIRDTVQQEIKELKRTIFQQANEIKFLKNMGENVLVIKEDKQGQIYEFRSPEKDALLELVNTYNQLQTKHENLIQEIGTLQTQIQKQQYFYREQIENNLDQIESYQVELETLKKRKLWARIWNKGLKS
jgi:hypothetical protein